MAGEPSLRVGLAEAACHEAHAVLLDHLQHHDAQHALQRLVRSMARLLDTRCAVVAQAAAGAAQEAWLGGPGAELEALQSSGWRVPLEHVSHPVGQLWVATSGSTLAAHLGLVDESALLEAMRPLVQTAAALVAARLEGRSLVPPASLSLARAAMREAGCFVWEWDIRSDVLADIDEGAAMLGYRLHDVGSTQADWNRLIHPEDAAQAEEAYQRHAQGETPLYRTVYRAKAADGSWRWLEERGRIIERDAQGQPSRMCGTQTDATLHHLLEQARRTQLAAEAANAAKTQFLSRVSHELRTPLNAVLGFAQLLELDQAHPLAPTQRRQVGLIREAGSHLLEMIGDLLDVSLVDAGRLPLQSRALPLAPLLAQCVALVQPQAEAAAVVIAPPCCPETLAVQADATRLKQVLLNLLSNAVKYNRPGGQVRLSVRVGADGLAGMEVLDTGLGIAPEHLSRLFEPFNRLGREHGPVPGVGLGLALSQRLVEAMGGTLGATSDATGTRFLVRLPMAAVD